jgi:guanosine-3',5'-bis(diphosphate) 3'-pyrophosphohydrolase
LEELAHRMRVNSTAELFVRLADGRVMLDEFPAHEVRGGRLHFVRRPAAAPETESEPTPVKAKKPEGALVLGMDKQSLDYSMAACCRPIPGDEVFGFVTVSGGIKIHRSACPNSTQLLSKYGYRVLKARWAGDEDRKGAEAVKATATIAFAGVDDIGLVNHITGIISADMSVDMKKVSFETNEGSFEGRIEVLVNDTGHLGELIERLRQVPGMASVDRLEDELP